MKESAENSIPGIVQRKDESIQLYENDVSSYKVIQCENSFIEILHKT